MKMLENRIQDKSSPTPSILYSSYMRNMLNLYFESAMHLLTCSMTAVLQRIMLMVLPQSAKEVI